jgi:hypothetical protein
LQTASEASSARREADLKVGLSRRTKSLSSKVVEADLQVGLSAMRPPTFSAGTGRISAASASS